LPDNFFLLKEVSLFLEKEITGYTVREIHTQEKDKLVISLSNKHSGEFKYIEYSCDDKLPYLLLKTEYSKARKNVLNLLAGLYDQEIISIELFNDDRIIKFDLSGELSLYFVFFKSKHNLLVVADEKVIDAFKSRKEFIGVNIAEYLSRKENKFTGKYNSVKEYFRSAFRQYGDSVFKEFLYNTKINGDDKLNDDTKGFVDNYIMQISERIKIPEFIVYKLKSGFLPSLLKLNYLEENEKYLFENVNELIQGYLKLHFGKVTNEDVKKNVLLQKENTLRNYEKKYNSLLKQHETAGNSIVFKNYGDYILSNIHLIKKGDDNLILEGDEYPEKIEIPLKKDLSPSENAAAFYDKYKRRKNSVDLLNEKIVKQEKEIDSLKSEIEEIKSNKNLKSLKKMDKEFNKEDESGRFRKFVLDEKHEVWVGKDSASNDLLTTRYSAQNDLWFHVRGASGSHTVLKITDKKNSPDKKIIETAASIAAYYSKARNASNVPVAYCERKYVKKKKGFKEGSVVMEREKVIFVKPGLPENLI
jgi:predicted ribosome quality control (RQC) complex YloA/Tae2 family protein